MTLVGPAGAGVQISSDAPFAWDANEELLAGAYLPGTRPGKHLAPLTIQHYEVQLPRRLPDPAPDVVTCGAWNGVFPLEMFHCAYALFRTQWVASRLAVFHAACVVDDRGAVLLVGPSGSGKTSLAMHMAKAGAKIFSGNTTLVDLWSDDPCSDDPCSDDPCSNDPYSSGLLAVSGTSTMTLSASAALQWPQATGGLPYGDRRAFSLPDEQRCTVSMPISQVLLVRLQSDPFAWEELSALRALHMLYPYAIDSQHTDCVLDGGRRLWSPPAEAPARAAIAVRLATALERVPTAVVCGEPAEIMARLQS